MSAQSQAEDIQLKPLLLLVDDDPLIVKSLGAVLEQDFDLLTADSRAAAKELVQSRAILPSIALVDLGLPPFVHTPEEGYRLIRELLAINSQFKILVLSGQDKEENIQHALTIGAVDFIPKPCDAALLKSRLQHQLMMLKAESKMDKTEARQKSFIGVSKEFQELKNIIQQFADMPFPVLIEGESGTGKELVAEQLHQQSQRSDKSFMIINCAAFSSELLESQLFGHSKGAFTGADKDKAGFFEEVGEGTLFLDEIGEMPQALQSKILRVLENGEYYRVGETQVRNSNARVIAATNRHLLEETQQGNFRKDLYHRLSVLTIKVMPLRERAKDCLVLLETFIKQFCTEDKRFTLDKAAQDFFLSYTFPGNIRELKNIVIRLSAKYSAKIVGLSELKAELNLTETTGTIVSNSINSFPTIGEGFNLDQALTQQEKIYVEQALEKTGGNLSKAARILGINRTTLYSRLQRLKISIED